MIRVVTADDQALVRGGLQMILEAQADISVVGEAADGVEAVELTTRLLPDVVLMDIRMPRLDGIEATRRLAKATPPSTRVVILTTFGLDSYVYEALHAGASGFLLKDSPPKELVRAVRLVAAGEALLSPAITQMLIDTYVRQRPATKELPEGLAELTPRELEVFRLLANGKSNAEIASELFLTEGTVKTHMTRILQKLELRDRVQAVVYAYESGFTRPGKSSDRTDPGSPKLS
jgi:DNA-binding NarL/FixJ family response regulator